MAADLGTTHTIALLIGLYFLAAGIRLMTDPPAMARMAKELVESPLAGFYGGLIAFAIGGAIVSVHNIWTGLLAGFVSLVGWIALIEGLLILAARAWFLGIFARVPLTPAFIRPTGAGTALVGSVLIWAALAS